MIMTTSQLSLILRSSDTADAWGVHLAKNLPAANIDTGLRIAAFMAQMAHESANFTRVKENLNYSAAGLRGTWPSRFNAVTADEYARKPEKIANKVYADRLGNGNEESGEGWKYRGRGIVQLTGKANYAECSQALFGDDRLVKNPDLLSDDKDTMVKSACLFWNTRKLSPLADIGDIRTMTKKINGGYNGLKERKDNFERNRRILGV